MTRREPSLYDRCALLTICSRASVICICDRRTTIRAYMVSPPTESGSGGVPRGRGGGGAAACGDRGRAARAARGTGNSASVIIVCALRRCLGGCGCAGWVRLAAVDRAVACVGQHRVPVRQEILADGS